MNWVRLSATIEPNRTPNFVCLISETIEVNGTESNSIHYIGFDWVRQSHSIECNLIEWMTWTAIQQRLFYGLVNKKNTCYTKVIRASKYMLLISTKVLKKSRVQKSKIRFSSIVQYFCWVRLGSMGHFRVLWYLCLTILMTMTLIYLKMKLHAELIFIWKVLHLARFETEA